MADGRHRPRLPRAVPRVRESSLAEGGGDGGREGTGYQWEGEQ